MPSRNTPFVNGEFYHIINRGVASMQIFNGFIDYRHFLKTILYYQLENPKPRLSLFQLKKNLLIPNQKIVNIVCYCFMPNHLHFLLQQIRDGGITEFMGKVSNSYTKYFNLKNQRNGPIFQGEFKSIYIETDEQILHLSRYIHLNPLVSYVTKNLDFYPWSSYPEYIGASNNNFCAKDIILEQFKSQETYKQFVLNQADYGKKLEMIKHQLLDYPQV